MRTTMDGEDIEDALHAIKQMVLVAYGATVNLRRDGVDREYFNIPEEDVNMLCFAIRDIDERVEKLKAGLFAKRTESA
jgi:hypothetical protein